ncbi:hypothetical protein GCM10011352_39380 [Marinobacterium zhoushanense]|uniref:Uncharacterized protein n=1 Tax=Marinobacterium zhoushanense TaxID=1679163 RepID=A0ABQ1KS29_9GAMM|nr:hypothetical protein [Marinobacterium zhoushanense]GGC09152.1 hypothetical protein GCM10011352_39380 [Marinobacterium zhoushanense]
MADIGRASQQCRYLAARVSGIQTESWAIFKPEVEKVMEMQRLSLAAGGIVAAEERDLPPRVGRIRLLN